MLFAMNILHIKFYYVSEWIPDTNITAVYRNASLQDILNDLFKDTLLNFYVLDDSRIILTQNSFIYDELPEGFFKESPGSRIPKMKKLKKKK